MGLLYSVVTHNNALPPLPTGSTSQVDKVVTIGIVNGLQQVGQGLQRLPSRFVAGHCILHDAGSRLKKLPTSLL